MKEVDVDIYEVPSKLSVKGRNTRATKQTDEVKETSKQGKRVAKEKVPREAVPVNEARTTRGARANLNTNGADYQNKTRPSRKAKSVKNLSSNIGNQRKREISQETLSRSSRRAKVESSDAVTQTSKGRKRIIDQHITELELAEATLKPKRTRNAQQQVPFVEKKSQRSKRNQTKTEQIQASPNKTRETKVTVKIPVKGAQGRNNTVPNTKKRRTSLVVSKKPPVMSPHAATGTSKAKKRISPLTKSPKPAVSTRRTKSEVKMSPQLKTRARVQGSSKESPKKSQPEITTRGRRNAGKPKHNSSSIQNKRRSEIEQETKPDSPKKRGRRNVSKPEETPFPAQSKVRPKVEQEGKTDLSKKRGRSTANKSVIVEEPQNKRSRKVAEKPQGPEKPTKKPTSVETYPKRGRIAKNNAVQPVKTVMKQGKKLAVQESTQMEPGKRSLRTKAEATNVVAETRKGRKRKNENEQQVVPAKVAKTDTKVISGRKATDVTDSNTTRGQKRSTKNNKIKTLKNEQLKDSKTAQHKTTPAQKTTKVANEAIKIKSKVAEPVKGNKVG